MSKKYDSVMTVSLLNWQDAQAMHRDALVRVERVDNTLNNISELLAQSFESETIPGSSFEIANKEAWRQRLLQNRKTLVEESAKARSMERDARAVALEAFAKKNVAVHLFSTAEAMRQKKRNRAEFNRADELSMLKNWPLP